MRPQQLFLSGDQVYADEANELLEHFYIQVGNTLMQRSLPEGSTSPPEKIRAKEDEAPDVIPAHIIPGERGHMHKLKEFTVNNRYKSFIDLLQEHANQQDYPPEYPGQADTRDCIHDLCGFTPTSRFHLLALADFFGLYLLNWSEVLWPAFYRHEDVKKWAIGHSVAFTNGEEDNLLSPIKTGIGKLDELVKAFITKLNNQGDPKNKASVEAAYALKHLRMVRSNFIEMLHMVIFAGELHFGLDLNESATDPSWPLLEAEVPEHGCLHVASASFQKLPRYSGDRANQLASLLYQKPFMLFVPAARMVPKA